jgi:hypothetical protein
MKQSTGLLNPNTGPTVVIRSLEEVFVIAHQKTKMDHALSHLPRAERPMFYSTTSKRLATTGPSSAPSPWLYAMVSHELAAGDKDVVLKGGLMSWTGHLHAVDDFCGVDSTEPRNRCGKAYIYPRPGYPDER